jgi:putative two-component system response regulator
MIAPDPARMRRVPASVLIVATAVEAERIATQLTDAGLDTAIAQDGAAALRLIPTRTIDLLLCDMILPDMEGTDLCQAIKRADATRTMAVIVMLEDDDRLARDRAMLAGADDVAVKPIERGMVIGLIDARLQIRRLQRQVNELEEVVVSLSRALDDRDAVSGGQSERIAHWSTQLGSAIGLAEAELTALYKAALLHDVGTLAVPPSILAKPGPLDPGEFSQVMRHPEAGERLLRAIPAADRVLPAVRHHHERIDGSGYPDGLAGDRIPLFARIVAIADAFVALTSVRPYRRRRSPGEAIEVLREGAGRQWDLGLVNRFVEVLKAVEAPSSEIESAG